MKNKTDNFVHIVNTDSHMLWDVMTGYFDMSGEQQNEELVCMHKQLNDFLIEATNGQVDYSMFRNILNPFSRFFMFVFDATKINKPNYADDINSKILKIFNKKMNALFMLGDYLVSPEKGNVLKKLFQNKLIDVSNWSDMTQYYLVCILGISSNTANKINELFQEDLSFCGYSDLTVDETKLKTYLCKTIPQASIKIKNNLFFGVPDDEVSLELNHSGFTSENVSVLGIELIPVPESLYLMFLTSRPHNKYMTKKELNNSIRICNPSIEFKPNYTINITDDKLKYIKEKNKLRISKKLLENEIRKAVDLFQISHIKCLEDKIIQFNVPMYLNEKVYVLALKWNFESNNITIITVVPT